MKQLYRKQTFSDGKFVTDQNATQSGDWMTKLDLQDIYFTLAIDPQSQKFLRFIWKHKIYQFQALPFGLNIVL